MHFAIGILKASSLFYLTPVNFGQSTHSIHKKVNTIHFLLYEQRYMCGFFLNKSFNLARFHGH